jgi:hypothetical protein
MSEMRTYYPPDAVDVTYAGRGRREHLTVQDRLLANRQKQHAAVADALAESARKIGELEEQLLEQGLSPARKQDIGYKLLRERAKLASLERSRRQMIADDAREKQELRETGNLPAWIEHHL